MQHLHCLIRNDDPILRIQSEGESCRRQFQGTASAFAWSTGRNLGRQNGLRPDQHSNQPAASRPTAKANLLYKELTTIPG